MEDLKTLIREVPDFPKPGILFYDITTLLKDKAGFRGVIDGLKDHYRDTQVDVVLGIEARGFIFAPALAYALGAGFVPVRKPKKLPAECVQVTYDLEYGTDTLEMHKDAVRQGDRVLIVDDLLATGGTAAAAARMVRGGRGRGGGTGLRGGVDLPRRARAVERARRLLAARNTTNESQMSPTRRARVRALAKINLDLRVLGKRPDGFHELRTVFQTISLADTLEIAFTPARKTAIDWWTISRIADNLVVRAARLAMEAMRATGRIEMRLTKRIPMGAGLGGGSSDAAAVLLALPALVGRRAGSAEVVCHRRAIGQRCSVLFVGRNGGGNRARIGAVSAAGRAGATGHSGGSGHPCEHGAGLSRPEPPFDNRITTK